MLYYNLPVTYKNIVTVKYYDLSFRFLGNNNLLY